MTDHELLKLAARAAPGIADGDVFYDMRRESVWKPLDDDGDALRLAVALNIGLRANGQEHWRLPNVSVAIWNIGDMGGRVQVEHGNDAGFATRRAIVLAAAAIGEAMP